MRRAAVFIFDCPALVGGVVSMRSVVRRGVRVWLPQVRPSAVAYPILQQLDLAHQIQTEAAPRPLCLSR
jgi:hypothetical protein